MSHEDHLKVTIKQQSLAINYPVGSKVIVKNNSSEPYEVGTVHGYTITNSDVHLLVDIEGRDNNPHMIMGIVRQYDERRNKALDKLNGVEQWNVLSEWYCFSEDE